MLQRLALVIQVDTFLSFVKSSILEPSFILRLPFVVMLQYHHCHRQIILYTFLVLLMSHHDEDEEEELQLVPSWATRGLSWFTVDLWTSR